MSRPRAGNGLTAFIRNGRLIPLILNSEGRWVTTGEAKSWPRCIKCRQPVEEVDEAGLCPKHDGKQRPLRSRAEHRERFAHELLMSQWDRRPLDDPRVDWREYLKTQP